MTNRREFLQTSTAIAGSLMLPKSVFAAPLFQFFHADSYMFWPVANPVQWSLQNAHDPILARAAQEQAKLTANDVDKIERLVVRRCSLNLLEIQRARVMVDHWASHRADLRPFFKNHRLACPEIEVVLPNRETETITTLTGDSFHYGLQLSSDFDLELFQSKWERQFVNEHDDKRAARGTGSGFAWTGLPDGFIPWAVLKSAWRRVAQVSC